MLPNKLKNTASVEMGNGVFSHVARHMPCLPVLLTTKSDHSFLQRNAQTRSNFCKNKISKQCLCFTHCKFASNACVATNTKNHPKPFSAERVIFLLVEAPPQSPTNTKCVLRRSPSDYGYAILRITASV